MSTQTTTRTRWAIRSIALAAGLAALLALPAPATGTQVGGVVAEFEGRTIDLSVDWEGAQACHVGYVIAKCFRSETAMDAWLAGVRWHESAGTVAYSSGCSSPVRLYDGTGYSGASLNLTSRGTWHNLASYGFDQRTSSYKIGACAAEFTDLANGQGASYGGSHTQPYDSAPSMLPGWNNDVSSVQIY